MELKKVKSPIVIVGAGVAGVSAADALRSAGYQDSIVLLSKEGHIPYDRPPLSKEVLRTHELPKNLPLRGEDFYVNANIDLRLGGEVRAIRTADRLLELKDDSYLNYSRLLLATGSRVRQFDVFPIGAPNVHYLRNLEDAVRLRSDMDRIGTRAHILVIGAGIIGLEVAAVATELGFKVTVVEAGTRPLTRAASPVLATFLAQAHAQHGVDIRCQTQISNVDAYDNGYRVLLSDQSVLNVNLVVVGIGVLPNVELAKSAGIQCVPEGVLVDKDGKTSAADVYAAGEVAFHFNSYHLAHRREETWQHAVSHGAHVAQAMLGRNEPYDERTSYWTDQYGYSVQVFGSPIGSVDVVRGDSKEGAFTIIHMDNDTVLGVTAVNSARELRKLKPLVLASKVLSIELVNDPAVDLSKLV